MTSFTQNLVQNLISLVLVSKSNARWIKSSSSQLVLEKRVYMYFAV